MPAKNENSSHPPVDFFSGIQPVCQWFKSAVVLLEASDGVPAVSDRDHLRSVETWLTRYDAWYRSGSGSRPGVRIRLLSYRELLPIGSLCHLEALCRLAELAHRLGMAFAYTFDAQELCEHEEAAQLLVARPGFAIAGIGIEPDTPLAISASLEASVLSLIDRGVNIAIRGPIDRLRAFGLLENPTVSSAVLRVIPRTRRPPGPPQEARSSGGSSVPCADLFRLHISRAGGVYPCSGLVGVPVARLASVYRPFEESVFAGRSTSLDIPSLTRNGPVLESAGHDARPLARRSQCERHRAQLLRDAG